MSLFRAAVAGIVLTTIATPAAAIVLMVRPTGVDPNGVFTQYSTGPSGTYGVELKGGNGATNGDWEIGAGARTSVPGAFNQGQLNWGCIGTGAQGCGTTYDFTLNWRPTGLSITIGTVTVVAPISGQPGFAPLVGDTLRIWAKRDASFTVTEVDGRALSVGGSGDLTGASGAPQPGGDLYFWSTDNWGGDGLIAKGTVRLKGGNGSSREIFFSNGDFDPFFRLPDPASWMTMILGFGLIGATLRRQRRYLATLNASALSDS